MLRNLWNHLASLHRFGGREGVKAFWTYAMAVLVGSLWAMSAVTLPAISGSLAKVSEFARAHPDQATVSSGPGHYSVQVKGYHPELMPDFAPLLQAIGLIAAATVMLLAAALVRRLHDSGRSGLWGLLPLPFLAAAFWLMPGLFQGLGGKGEPEMGPVLLLLANNAAYLLSLGVLIYLTIKPGDAGANAFGAPPRDPGQL